MNLIQKVLRLKCIQRIPSKKDKLTKLTKIPSILNLKKKYTTFMINHNFTDLNTPVLLIESGDSEIELILNYKYFSYGEIINLICNRQMPVSYETVGDVIHFNLNDEYLPYKFLIGKILFDKTGYTIINKLGNINSTFRYYDFEYIGWKIDINKLRLHSEMTVEDIKYTIEKCNINKLNNEKENQDILNTEYKLNKEKESQDIIKDHDILSLNKEDFITDSLRDLLNKYSDSSIIIKMDKLETTLIENSARFYIDIKNVYWCSKLQEERRKLLNEINSGEVVCDVFCGLGPMVIPLLLKECVVYCNDLNIKAIECLKRNLEINKINTDCFINNLDAKDFLEKIRDIKIDHFILNLPEYSIDYIKYIKSGRIHCYFFSSESEVEEYVFKKTGFRNQDVRFIRKVSPSKNVYKLTLQK